MLIDFLCHMDKFQQTRDLDLMASGFGLEGEILSYTNSCEVQFSVVTPLLRLDLRTFLFYYFG
jgi:hypothetical protein